MIMRRRLLCDPSPPFSLSLGGGKQTLSGMVPYGTKPKIVFMLYGYGDTAG